MICPTVIAPVVVVFVVYKMDSTRYLVPVPWHQARYLIGQISVFPFFSHVLVPKWTNCLSFQDYIGTIMVSDKNGFHNEKAVDHQYNHRCKWSVCFYVAMCASQPRTSTDTVWLLFKTGNCRRSGIAWNACRFRNIKRAVSARWSFCLSSFDVTQFP